MLETVARASTNNPDVLRFRVAIQNEIAVRGVFVLAYPAFQQRGLGQRRTAHPQVGARCAESFFRYFALHCAGINDCSTRVVSDLEAAPMVSRYSEEGTLPSVYPGWQLLFVKARVSRRSAEEEDLLTGWSDVGR